MAKKKKSKAKVRTLKSRKVVKGGLRVKKTGDPCDGGEIAARLR
jgi:hypothetical protein